MSERARSSRTLRATVSAAPHLRRVATPPSFRSRRSSIQIKRASTASMCMRTMSPTTAKDASRIRTPIRSKHFASADGHFNPSGEGHGHHAGDLPALFFSANGEAWAKFTTDHFKPEELRGRALILHVSSDNYGNVPVGDGDDQYTPNSDAASELTMKTGNAGARLGCGVIE